MSSIFVPAINVDAVLVWAEKTGDDEYTVMIEKTLVAAWKILGPESGEPEGDPVFMDTAPGNGLNALVLGEGLFVVPGRGSCNIILLQEWAIAAAKKHAAAQKK